MSSEVRIPFDTNTSRPERTSVLALPDILAMTQHGQPAPGARVKLPSGAVWQGGHIAGTSVITLPGAEPILVEGEAAANTITGTALRSDVLANVFRHVLGVMPKLFAHWSLASAAAERGTSVVRISTRASIRKYGKGDAIEELRAHDPAAQALPDAGERMPIRRASGGMVSGPGGARDDSIVARLSNGEYVVNAAATANSLPLLEALNAGWVPSAGFLAGMLPGFAAGGLVGNSAAGLWRELLGQGLIAPMKPAVDGFRPQDFGIFGWAADIFGGLANSAADAGGAAGAALGSAIAPVFAPSGLLGSLFGGPSNDGSRSWSAVERRSTPETTGAPDPMSASLRIEPRGIPAGGLAFSTPVGNLSSLYPPTTPGGAQSAARIQIGTLADAFGRGMEAAAIEAGGRVGAALGAAIGPALGPAGVLAPEIGAQLGSLIGSRFGGSLRASMTVTGQTGSNPAGYAYGTNPVDTNGPSVRESYQPWAGNPAASYVIPGTAGDSWSALPGAVGDAGQPWLNVGPYWIPKRYGVLPNSSTQNGQAGAANPVEPGGSVGEGTYGGIPVGGLAQTMELARYNPTDGNFAGWSYLVGQKFGENAGNSLVPLLGLDPNLPKQFGSVTGELLGQAGLALSAADPTHNLTNALGYLLGPAADIPWQPKDYKPPQQMPLDQQAGQVGQAALQGGIAGLQQHGLVGGITGAISGAASSIGGLAGGAIGTAIAPFLGPVGAVAPAIGQALGSVIGSTAAGVLTKPIEWAANAAKEEVGSGFGLVNLAKGPGGHTARGDMYNFNGMDPKSAAIAVERVRRRRTVAQQRGGGLGR
ncbi:hypothetical protein [Nocardia arthritidis]|uniref:Uncharacterized protein n=1 Tax=Nocardia arthritidis TaxID=228602 RepID=A0A6G9YU96_9NOCA|nr:hypothetical protein [Nocardia arthritidis]QIS16576.1 hypothetical protein F5544_43865 [Nocardia arthritidis]